MNASRTPIRAVLFDKDGTLIDFHDTWMPAYRAAVQYLAQLTGHARLGNELMELAGYDAANATLRADSPLACGTTAEIADLWVARAGLREHPQARATILTIFHRHATAAPRATAELDTLFATLRAQGLALGVATMDSTTAALESLESLGVRSQIDFVAGFDAGFGAKPEPGMVRAFGAAVGLSAEAIAVVGDSVIDLQMGRNARAGLCIGVLSGVTGRAQLLPLADIVLDDVSAVPDALV